MSRNATADMDEGVRPEPARLGVWSWISITAACAAVALLIYRSLHHEGPEHEVHAEPPPAWGVGILPFVGVLGCIAILPLLPRTKHWWESNRNRLVISLAFGSLTILYYVLARGVDAVPLVLEHAVVKEYIPFITLLFCLYVISGGISLRGDLPAHPTTNTAFLAVGAAIASFVGTTGASMLLIRPLLQTNAQRKHVVHTVVFFIFLVSNIGGCLLPIGDPPLFLGYLFGVPFFWTLGLWPPWLICCGILLVVYFVWDTIAYRKEDILSLRLDELQRQPLKLQGWSNFLLLLGIVACVAYVDPHRSIPGTDITPWPFTRELIMLLLVAVSLGITPKGVRAYNQFNYSAILEVAALFIGIFITMQVPIEYLNARGAELGVDNPWEFFWATGSLSSFLDNAPTYVVFFETARVLPIAAGAGAIEILGGTIAEPLLVGVSLGAVFMGAMTYIGNGPNFMVKSIAEQTGLAMPSFFGYMFKYSIPILIPTFIAVTMLFLMSWSPLA
ncbi:MAG: sodium:proton antiporter [Planctomycetota bacterium]|jgi:Na+/H+ antiporter NhaD/arsenite permease-like protein